MTPAVTDNPERERYELRLGDELVGLLEYRGRGRDRALTHTEIYEGHEGQGLAGHLVKNVLEDLREKGLQVIPVCPYVTKYLRDHPEYMDLVEPGLRAGLGLTA
ncbi:MAG: N-acetyltransferase [Actinomycetota bacterium]|nr:N-acetyltransferase [Actinomycetota bacterium]